MATTRRPLIGWLSDVDKVPLFLKGPGLKAHTLIVGQSGSGKSFMLGRFIEEVLIATDASVVILDPNADFLRLSDIDDSAWDRFPTDTFHELDTRESFRESWASIPFRILSMRAGSKALRLPPNKATRPALEWPNRPLRIVSALGFDTKVHTDEVFSIMRAVNMAPDSATLDEFVDVAKDQWQKNNRNDASERADLAVYIRTVEAGLLPVWANKGQKPTVDQSVQELFDRKGALCVDLASLESPDSRLLVTAAALDKLWSSSRKDWFEALAGSPDKDPRRPVFVVIDEAHNLAPAKPTGSASANLVADLLARIATEGRKYGIYLVLVTQRPGRLDETLRTQCDNLCLLKMNDRIDLQVVEQSFGFIPQGWTQRAMEFKQGDVLLAGSLVERPVYARTAPRRTVEGGRNIRDLAWLPYLRD